MKPISPNEVVEQKAAMLPDFVVVAANEMIAQTWKGSSAHFTQESLIERILSSAPEGVTRGELFGKHYLDIEDIYREVGWIVEYDKPGYNESYEANFTFRKKKE